MGATNTTTHYNLSQFVSTDKPAWLQDYNGDMAKIDAGIDAAKVAADTAQTTANSASGAATQNSNDITALQTSVSGMSSNITAIQLSINTINSLIGNGTPTTTDQTLIGAINEINANATNHSLDSSVDLRPYTKSSPFIAPGDGYITAHSNYAHQNVRVYATDANKTIEIGCDANYSIQVATNSLFVRKGMLIYRADGDTTYEADNIRYNKLI